MTHAVNWQIALEYIKVLVAPIATLVGVVVVSFLGLRTFRRQKAIERRLEWYQQMHRLLGRVSTAYGHAALAAKGPDAQRAKQRQDEALKLSDELAHVANEGWLFADQTAFAATQMLFARMARWHQLLASNAITQQLADQVSNVCHETANALSSGMRVELGMGKVQALTPAQLEQRIGPAA